MAQPNLDSLRSHVEIAVIWFQRSYHSGVPKETTLRFGLRNCFIQGASDWTIGNTVVLDEVAAGGQYYDNLVSLGPLRQGFTPGYKAKIKETVLNIEIAKTTGNQKIGNSSTDWDAIKILATDYLNGDQGADGYIGVFVFDPTQGDFDPDADMVFKGNLKADSFKFESGKLELSVTDILSIYNRPVLRTMGYPNWYGSVNHNTDKPIPRYIGEWDFKTPNDGLYRFVELIPQSIWNDGTWWQGLLRICDTEGTNGVWLDTGWYLDNIIHHFYNGTLISSHRMHTITTRTDTFSPNDDGLVLINNQVYSGTTGSKLYPPSTPIDGTDFDAGHKYYMIQHFVKGALETGSSPFDPIENPMDVWAHMASWVGVSSSEIGTSWAGLKVDFASSKCRRIVKEQIDFYDLIDEINQEWGIAVFTDKGKFEFCKTPLHNNQTVDYTIYPSDIVTQNGKLKLEINSDGTDALIGDNSKVALKYDSNQGFTLSTGEQDFFQSSGSFPAQPDPPGHVTNEPEHDGYYEVRPDYESGNENMESEEAKYIYEDVDASGYVDDLAEYRKGETTNLRRGKVTINKRFIGTDNPLGAVIKIMKTDYNSDDELINGLVYDVSVDFSRLQATLSFQEVDI